MKGGSKKARLFMKGVSMGRSRSDRSLLAPSGAVRWEYVRGRWVRLPARRCATPGCHFNAVGSEPFCIRCRKNHVAPLPSSSAPRAEQLSLFTADEESPKERR
jgi:hypothetical protein